MRKTSKLAAILLALSLLAPTSLAFADVGEGDVGDTAETSNSLGQQIEPYANTGDVSFYFSFSKSGATSQCKEPRRKDNTTPAYVNVKRKDCDRCRAYIDRKNGTKWENVTSQGKATIKSLGQKSIKLSKNSSGYMVRLTGWADSTKGDVSGVWSPDSTRTYTVINGG